jgi:ParB family chromosome partitioning protein
MATRPSGLGRGIASLIPAPAPAQNTPALHAVAAQGEVLAPEAVEHVSNVRPITELHPVPAVRHDNNVSRETSDSSRQHGTPRKRPVDVFFDTSAKDAPSGSESVWDDPEVAGRIGLVKPESEGRPELAPIKGVRFAELMIDMITPNARQPRTIFDEGDLAELTASIKEIGLLQPIVVRPRRDGFELIMGERRWRASRRAGLRKIPAIIRETDDAAMLRDALLENLHRANLNPLEEATAYRQLLDDFGCTQEELAAKVARSRSQISNTLRLLKLPPLIQRRLAKGDIQAGHARAILGLDDPDAMERLAQRVIADGLSVRQVEEIVAAWNERERRPRAPKPTRSPAMEQLGVRLSERFAAKVNVRMGPSVGKVVIEFDDLENLNRILHLIAPNDPGLVTEAEAA